MIIGYSYKAQVTESQIKEAEKFFPIIEEVYGISGTINEIGTSYFILNVTFPLNPFDETPKTRKIIITNSTKISEQIPKDYAAFQKELEEYQITGGIPENETGQLFPAPVTFTERALAFSELGVGDSVSVSSDQNIKSEKEFEGTAVIRLTFNKVP